MRGKISKIKYKYIYVCIHCMYIKNNFFDTPLYSLQFSDITCDRVQTNLCQECPEIRLVLLMDCKGTCTTQRKC